MNNFGKNSPPPRSLWNFTCSSSLVLWLLLGTVLGHGIVSGFVITHKNHHHHHAFVQPQTTTWKKNHHHHHHHHHRRRSGYYYSTASSTNLQMALHYPKVFVAGGSRGVGRLVIDKLIDKGIQVVALCRNEDTVAELNGIAGVTAVLGDAFDRKSVETAMDGCQAAITTLGGSTNDRRVDYEGNANVIESAGILGITRIIFVTSIGCGSSKEAAPPAVFEVLKDVLAAKEKAENMLMKYYTNTNWTIIRPGGLKSEPMTGQGILTEDCTAIGSIHREDVAALIVQALDSTNTHQKILSAIDPSITSSVAVEGKVISAFAL